MNQRFLYLVLLLALVTSRVATAQTSAFAAEMAKAEAALQAEAFDEAIKSYKRANSKADKKSAAAFLGMARAHLALGQHDEAIDACRDALVHVAQDRSLAAHLHNLRGIALTQTATKADDKRLMQAEADLRRAIELDANVRTFRFNLGLALMKMNRDEDGIAALKEFLARDPNAPAAAEARRTIDDPRRAREPFAPEFSFVALDDRSISLQELKGKTILIDFWGTWCPPCIKATPDLVGLAKRFAARDFILIGISSDKTRQVVEDYVKTTKITWPQYVDLDRKLHRAYGVTGFPMYVIVDGDGVVRGRQVGHSQQIMMWLRSAITETLERQEKANAGKVPPSLPAAPR
jgi:tetratricopeptide (TPR) repeat protein